jgi:hypothetical protein
MRCYEGAVIKHFKYDTHSRDLFEGQWKGGKEESKVAACVRRDEGIDFSKSKRV